jgi:sugar phosphate isomerase/epimerase
MRTALHTVSYAGVWPGQARLDLPAVIRRAGQLGYDGVMIMAKRPHLSPLDATPAALAELRGVLEETGVTVACLAGYTNFTADAAHPDIPLVEMQIAYVTELARLAQALLLTPPPAAGGGAGGVGSPIIRVFTGYGDPALTLAQVRDRCVTALRECARRAADFGCTLAVQNHHDFACHYETMHDLLLEIAEPNCRAAFDAWAPTLHGDDLAAAARKMAPLTVWTTCADYVYRPRFRYQPQQVNYEPQLPAVQAVPMGEGMVDYPAFLGALREAGYDGWTAYEMCSPLAGGGGLENLDRCAQKFVDFMRNSGR